MRVRTFAVVVVAVVAFAAPAFAQDPTGVWKMNPAKSKYSPGPTPKAQTITIKDQQVTGDPLNIFMGTKESLSMNHSFNIEPWGYIVYDY